jgi:hypothetical protein
MKISVPRQRWLLFSFAFGHQKLTRAMEFAKLLKAIAGYQRCFLTRVYPGLARVHEGETKRFPNRRFSSLGTVRVRKARQAGLGLVGI